MRLWPGGTGEQAHPNAFLPCPRMAWCFPTRPSMSTIPCKKREDYLEWPEYFMAVAFLSAQRSKDPNSQVRALSGRMCCPYLLTSSCESDQQVSPVPALGPGRPFLSLVGTATGNKPGDRALSHLPPLQTLHVLLEVFGSLVSFTTSPGAGEPLQVTMSLLAFPCRLEPAS